MHDSSEYDGMDRDFDERELRARIEAAAEEKEARDAREMEAA